MKTLHLSIIIITGIVSLVVLGIYFVLNPINDASPKVIITNIETNPPILHPKDWFSINATIYNNSIHMIRFTTDSITTTFDKNMIVVHNMGCSNLVGGRNIMPYQSVAITLPYGCDNYFANSTGIANATLHLGYVLDKIEYTVNASKTFTIVLN